MKLILLFLATTLALSGCLPGNAEGYGNKPKSNQVPGNEPNTVAAGTYYYYLLDPTYTCRIASTGQVIPSYRESIALWGSQVFLLGDRCNARKEPIPSKDILISSTHQYLGYRDGIYLYVKEPITDALLSSLRPVEALCTTVLPLPDSIRDIAIRNPLKPEDPLTAHVQFAAEEAIINVNRLDSSNIRTYASATLELEVTLPDIDFVYGGQLKLQVKPYQQEMRCRLNVY